MADLITVETALQYICERVSPLPAEHVPTPEALDRVLAEDVFSTVDIPPFPNSSMDGYAVRASDVAAASSQSPVGLSVVADIPAGQVIRREIRAGEAARIMTGAPLPPGADAVVPVEQTSDSWRNDGEAPLQDHVQIFRSVERGAYVRPVGEDIAQGQRVLPRGTVIRPQDLGVLVSIGQAGVRVHRRPRVALLATGDELVDLNEPLAAGQIRNSNSYMLAGLVKICGGDPIRLPIARDSVPEVRRQFEAALATNPDLVISSAGVSVGTRDVVRTVVEELGELGLWRVNLRPGKPLAFGRVGSVPFFGLPGNPVSSMITFEIFVRPALLILAGRDGEKRPVVSARTAEALTSDGRRTYMRVRLHQQAGEIWATSTGTQSSGALMSMVLADGLMIIPEDVTHVPAGTELPVWLLRENFDARPTDSTI